MTATTTSVPVGTGGSTSSPPVAIAMISVEGVSHGRFGRVDGGPVHGELKDVEAMIERFEPDTIPVLENHYGPAVGWLDTLTNVRTDLRFTGRVKTGAGLDDILRRGAAPCRSSWLVYPPPLLPARGGPSDVGGVPVLPRSDRGRLQPRRGGAAPERRQARRAVVVHVGDGPMTQQYVMCVARCSELLA